MSLLKIFLVSIIAVLLIGCGETEKPKDVVNVPVTKPVDKTPKVPTPILMLTLHIILFKTNSILGFVYQTLPNMTVVLFG